MRNCFLILFSAVFWLPICGCSTDDGELRREFAEKFVGAVADGDEEIVWESFTPESRQEMVAKLGNGDEDAAVKELTLILQNGIKKQFDLDDAGDLTGDEDKFDRAVGQVLNDADNKLKKIDGEYFLHLKIEEISKK